MAATKTRKGARKSASLKNVKKLEATKPLTIKLK